MNNIQDIVSKTFEGLELTDEQKKTITGVYLINIYKIMLEMLITFKIQEVEFNKKLNDFFNSSISSLNEKQKKQFNEVFEGQKAKLLADIMNFYKDNLTPELKSKMEQNLANLTSST